MAVAETPSAAAAMTTSRVSRRITPSPMSLNHSAISASGSAPASDSVKATSIRRRLVVVARACRVATSTTASAADHRPSAALPSPHVLDRPNRYWYRRNWVRTISLWLTCVLTSFAGSARAQQPSDGDSFERIREALQKPPSRLSLELPQADFSVYIEQRRPLQDIFERPPWVSPPPESPAPPGSNRDAHDSAVVGRELRLACRRTRSLAGRPHASGTRRSRACDCGLLHRA